jgi:hypothetical protein
MSFEFRFLKCPFKYDYKKKTIIKYPSKYDLQIAFWIPRFMFPENFDFEMSFVFRCLIRPLNFDVLNVPLNFDF